MSEMDAATVLEEAADLLLVHGRAVGNYQIQGRFCALGAINQVETGNALGAGRDCRSPGIAALARHLRMRPEDLLGIALWSDSRETDFEVIDTLRRVAKDIRNETQP